MTDNADNLIPRLQKPGTALCTLPGNSTTTQWGIFEKPVEILSSTKIGEIQPMLAMLNERLRRGWVAAGYIAYDAAPAFDENFRVRGDGTILPLLYLALYSEPPEPVCLPQLNNTCVATPFTNDMDGDAYQRAFATIHRHIVAGDLYQANLTFRCRSQAVAAPEQLFLSLLARQPVPYGAYLNLGSSQIISLSPELFLERRGDAIVSSPMKGTAPRKPQADMDRAAARDLARDSKNRAENLMITDMVRNDLGRICQPDSITVKPLFHVDTYCTVHQMISSVHGTLRSGLSLGDIFAATFPPASITGAPKISTMDIISTVESSPRQLYTGAIGCFLSPRSFRLNVAIRTLVQHDQRLTTGVGGGITYDSQADHEWQEALLKCRYATLTQPDFEVFETIRWSAAEGFAAQAAHIRRAESSQRYFQRPVITGALAAVLQALDHDLRHSATPLPDACVKVILSRNGDPRTEYGPPRQPDWSQTPLKILVAKAQTRSDDVFLYHKTTNRAFYNTQWRQAVAKGFHELLFSNENGDLTEGAISNVFIRKGKKWFTPHCDCGLLPGIWRAEQIAALGAKETRISLDDLMRADMVIVGNSLRGTGLVGSIHRE